MKVVLTTAFVTALISFLLSPVRTLPPTPRTARQSSIESNIEVKRDGFTGATLVRLREVSILSDPDHTLTMEIETKVGDSSPAAQLPGEEPRALVMFTSLSAKGRDFGDRELHFLIDGKPLRVGVAAESPSFPNPDARATSWRVGSHIHIVIPLANLEQIVQGKTIRMRLGSVETTLPSAAMTKLRSFMNAADNAKAVVRKEDAR